MKIGLGTVQFGLDYGVTNRSGMVARGDVVALIKRASVAGVRVIDTAAAYGDSESVLGDLMPGPQSTFHLVTKTIPLRASRVGSDEMRAVRSGFERSLQRLRVPRVNTLLVHHADDLLVPGGEHIYEKMLEWRDAGLVASIGFSAYDAEQVERVLSRFSFSVVQLPVSVFDQRLIENGLIFELESLGVAIHARSIFLQGLLLAGGKVPDRFRKWAHLINRYHDLLAANAISPLQAAIGFVARLSPVQVALIGVTSVNELEQCLKAYSENLTLDFSYFACRDIDLLDPRRWATAV